MRESLDWTAANKRCVPLVAFLLYGVCGASVLLAQEARPHADQAAPQHMPTTAHAEQAGRPPSPLDAEAIGRAAGQKAATTKNGIVRLTWARNDVPVKVDGVELEPFAGLGTWAAFSPAHAGAMLMGDTVVFADEINPAIDAAFENGLEVTALHNHFLHDEPKVYFMHIGGDGDPLKLAAGVKAVWDAIKAVRAAHPQPATTFGGPAPTAGSMDSRRLDQIIGHPSESQKGVVKITIARTGEMHGVGIGGDMGLTTWAAFSGSDEAAVVDGDFIMTVNEIQPVLKTLRKSGINIVALHNHMVDGQPMFFFTHFWGKGPASKLAEGLRAALDAQAAAGKIAAP